MENSLRASAALLNSQRLFIEALIRSEWFALIRSLNAEKESQTNLFGASRRKRLCYSEHSDPRGLGSTLPNRTSVRSGRARNCSREKSDDLEATRLKEFRGIRKELKKITFFQLFSPRPRFHPSRQESYPTDFGPDGWYVPQDK